MEMMGLLNTQQFRQRVNILGVLVDQKSLDEVVQYVEEMARLKRNNPGLPGRFVVTANPEYIMTARKSPEFSRLVNSAGLITVDGVGLVWAGMLLGTPFRERVTGVELTHAIARRSAETGIRIFLLGAGPGIAEQAAENLRKMYPGVVIAGCFSGQAGPEGDEEAVKLIREAQTDIVLVAYGMVKQDYWGARNLQACGAAVCVGIGGTLDFLSGRVPRAPKVIRKLGLEWVYRLYREPWRWRRDIAMFEFGFKVVQKTILDYSSNGKKLLVMEPPEPIPDVFLTDYTHKQPA